MQAVALGYFAHLVSEHGESLVKKAEKYLVRQGRKVTKRALKATIKMLSGKGKQRAKRGGAPKAFRGQPKQTQSKIQTAKAGEAILVSGEVVYDDVWSNDANTTSNLRQLRLADIGSHYLRHQSRLYQHYRVKSATVEYVPNQSATKDGTIGLLPIYGVDGVDGSSSDITMDIVQDSPDGVADSLWKPLSCRIDPKKFNKVDGKYTIRGGSNNPDVSPCGIAWVVEGAQQSGTAGRLRLKYTIELSGYNPRGEADFCMIRKDATDSAALGLDAVLDAEIIGDFTSGDRSGGLFEGCDDNDIRFNVSGEYLVYVNWYGTAPRPHTTDHSAVDIHGNVNSTRFFRHSTGNSFAGTPWYIYDNLQAGQFMFVKANRGDILTLDSLTGGSMTSYMIMISECNSPNGRDTSIGSSGFVFSATT